MAFHDLIHSYQQQDVDLDKLFMDLSVYNSREMDKAQVEPMLDLVIHAALSYRGVAHMTIPTDIQVMTHADRSKRNLPHHTSDVLGRGIPVPDMSDLKEAAALLNAGRKVAIVAGQGALGAAAELEEVAELLAAPIV